MRTLEEARLESLDSLQALRDAVTDPTQGTTFTPGLRSACWKAFLLFENLNRDSWSPVLAESRNAYVALRDHFIRPLEHPEELGSSVDPLSENIESPWVALRNDEALRAEIFQDVERCMPDNVYFRQPSTQTTLLDILFIFCKLNPDIGYRQGMHEVLAPILWVVERDAVETCLEDEVKIQNSDRIILDVFNQNFIEHDAFTLFSLVMQHAKFFYAPAEQGKKGSEKTEQKESPMVLRSRRIFEYYLPRADPELATHLTEIDIVPQIFLMRWVRLLFGREFPFDDVLTIWDLLFSQDPSLGLVDYICVAMLLRIRWQLIDADTNDAFTLLLRYPKPAEPPRYFVEDALYLQQNLTWEGGSFLIRKYSNRSPAPFSPKDRPSSPADSMRSRSPFGSSFGSPFGSPTKFMSQAGSIESILQDAARGVYSRSQKWGVNKAVRDAVEEVKKNVQGLQSGRSTPRIQYHRSQRSQPDTTGTGGNSIIRRVSALESRNKELAAMLSTAVNELWAWHGTHNEKNNTDTASAEALSIAIAKVQFVQVYLEDSSIPLPLDDNQTKASASATEEAGTESAPESAISDTRPELADSPRVSSDIQAKDRPQDIISEKGIPKSPHLSIQEDRISVVRSPTPPAPAPVKSPSHRQRASLANSSFSWMLGQDERSSAFASASPRNAFPPEMGRLERKKDHMSGKGFLFGEEEETSSPVKETKPKPRGGRQEQTPEEEVIDLGPLEKIG